MSTNHTFHPEAVKTLSTAFYKAWTFISNDPRFAMENPALLQRRLSACLMQLATEGEHDPSRLSNGAINRMRHEYSPKLPVLQERRFHRR
jgi:hypothetical protein